MDERSLLSSQVHPLDVGTTLHGENLATSAAINMIATTMRMIIALIFANLRGARRRRAD
jgi:hypothetical protein